MINIDPVITETEGVQAIRLSRDFLLLSRYARAYPTKSSFISPR